MNKYNVDIIEQFRRTNVGFIDPIGQLHPVEFYQHFETLSKFDEFKDDIEAFENELEEASDAHIKSIPEGEHPEWHIYEIWEDNRTDEFKREIMYKAYGLGWVRVGTYDVNMELEGFETGIKKHRKYATEIAELLNAELTENVIKKDNA